MSQIVVATRVRHPDGVNHYKRMYDITDGLIRRGYSDANIVLILGGNFRSPWTNLEFDHRQAALGILNSRC